MADGRREAAPTDAAAPTAFAPVPTAEEVAALTAALAFWLSAPEAEANPTAEAWGDTGSTWALAGRREGTRAAAGLRFGWERPRAGWGRWQRG